MIKRWLIVWALCLGLAACSGASGPSNAPSGPSKEPPKFTGVKVGKPYCIAGKWYRPSEDPYYDKTGVASWYGPGFNGKSTANGETYNQHDLTAAHPTLPMPCFVKVTNLDNGKTATVRVNDRGPFHSDRIIDLSKAAAQQLGVIATGTAQVRVQYLKEASEVYVASNGKIWPDELAVAQFGKSLMPRETMEHSNKPDSAYYQIQDDYVPAPASYADNNGIVVESVPVLSVKQRDLQPPALIKPAMADEAPYPSAREQDRIPVASVAKGADPYTSALKQMQGKQETAKPADAKQVQVASALPASLPEKAVQQAVPSAAAQSTILPKNSVKKIGALRVASFSARENAEKLMHQLLPVGQPELQPVIIDGRNWFRVYLHPSGGKNPEELLATIHKMGLRDARIVK